MCFSTKLESILSVEKVDLKWIFDHFRNYGIAGALMFAAHHTAQTAVPVSPIPYFNWFAATVYFVLSIALYSINFLQGIYAARNLLGSIPKWAAVTLFVTWAMVMQELLGVRIG